MKTYCKYALWLSMAFLASGCDGEEIPSADAFSLGDVSENRPVNTNDLAMLPDFECEVTGWGIRCLLGFLEVDGEIVDLASLSQSERVELAAVLGETSYRNTNNWNMLEADSETLIGWDVDRLAFSVAQEGIWLDFHRGFRAISGNTLVLLNFVDGSEISQNTNSSPFDLNEFEDGGTTPEGPDE